MIFSKCQQEIDNLVATHLETTHFQQQQHQSVIDALHSSAANQSQALVQWTFKYQQFELETQSNVETHAHQMNVTPIRMEIIKADSIRQ